MTVGERIKEIRTKLGMSQVDFADKINVSKQTLYKYENNIITNIPSDKVEEAARIGYVSPAYLMGWESESEMHYFEKFATQAVADLIAALPDNIASHTRDYYELSLHNQMLVNKYTKNLLANQHMEEELTVQAAHERTDIEVTDEMRQHDDDIMDDEDF